MSRPQFPINPDISREDVINQVISSIASEELAIGHILNAQGEAIQYAIGTIPGLEEDSTIEDVLKINDSVNGLLNRTLESQIMLNGKLSDAMCAPVIPGAEGPTGPTGPTGPAEGAAGPAGPIGPIGPTGPAGLNGPIGATGPTGSIGGVGSAGVTGATGAAGVPAPTPPPTANAGFAANTIGTSFPLLIVGTVVDIPLPNAQLLSGVTVNGANTQFTVTNGGLYRISYHVNTTLAVLVGTRLLINGGTFTPSIIPVSLGRARFENEIEVSLSANSTITLQLTSGLIGSATLLGGGAGASLMIVQLG